MNEQEKAMFESTAAPTPRPSSTRRSRKSATPTGSSAAVNAQETAIAALSAGETQNQVAMAVVENALALQNQIVELHNRATDAIAINGANLLSTPVIAAVAMDKMVQIMAARGDFEQAPAIDVAVLDVLTSQPYQFQPKSLPNSLTRLLEGGN